MPDFLYTIIIFPIVQIIEIVFAFSQVVFKEAGVSIVLVSCIVSVLTLPLYENAERIQKKEDDLQKSMKSKVDKIKAVFKGDEKYLMLSTYYKQCHYHPLYSLRTSLSVLIQIPFFIAAYSYLSHLEIIQNVSFLFVKNLAVPDSLLSIGSFHINILPVVMTFINCVSSAVYTRASPVKDRIMLYATAAVFLVLLYDSPAGLVLYWICNNIFSLFKNIYHGLPSRRRMFFLKLIISLVCFFIAYYVFFVYRGYPKLARLIAELFVITGLLPHVISIIRKKTRGSGFKVLEIEKPFLLFFFACLSISVLVGVYLPSTLLDSSTEEFANVDKNLSPLLLVFISFSKAAGYFLFWPFCIYALFPKNAKKYISVFLACFCVTVLCNTFFFDRDYGFLSLEMQFSDGNPTHNFTDNAINTAVLLGLCCVVLFLVRKKLSKVLVFILAVSSVSIITLSAMNVFSIGKKSQHFESFISADNRDIKDIKPIIHLSKTGKNTVVVMLDRAMSVFVPYIFDENPELKEIFEGFVYYPNTVSFNGFTRAGAPPLFGGYEYTPQNMNERADLALVKKHNEALLLMPVIFSRAGYQVTVIDPPYPNYSYSRDLRIYDNYKNIKAYNADSIYAGLWSEEHDFKIDSTADNLKRNVFLYSVMRVLPMPIRFGIYTQGNWMSPVLRQKLSQTLNAYSVLDYLPRLTDFKTTEKNTALIIVNNLTHEPSFFQAPEYRPAFNITNYGEGPFRKETTFHANVAALKRVGDWFLFLKQENVFDNTKIIIVSDHGSYLDFFHNKDFPINIYQFNPLLMEKDFNAHEPLRTDNTFMTNADTPYLAFKGQIADPENPWTGKLISINDKQYPLYIAVSSDMQITGGNEITVDPARDYYVSKDIFDPENWIRADKYQAKISSRRNYGREQ